MSSIISIIICGGNPSRLTWFSVTNSASSPTRSPAWGISLTIKGMKVA